MIAFELHLPIKLIAKFWQPSTGNLWKKSKFLTHFQLKHSCPFFRWVLQKQIIKLKWQKSHTKIGAEHMFWQNGKSVSEQKDNTWNTLSTIHNTCTLTYSLYTLRSLRRKALLTYEYTKSELSKIVMTTQMLESISSIYILSKYTYAIQWTYFHGCVMR